MTIQTQTVRTKTNREFIIEKDDTLYSVRLSGEYKGYQIGNLRRFRDLTPNARTIIDVGANIGNNSIEYATWAQRVEAFEPTPHTRQWLTDNIAYNKTNWSNDIGWYKTPLGWADMNPQAPIRIHPYALGAADAQLEMLQHERNGGHNHIINGDTKSKKERYTVDVKTIDGFGFKEVDGIKIDVEGWELYVLQGAETTIMRDRPIIQTEIVEAQCKRAGYAVQDLCDWFAQRDYIRTLRDSRVMPQKYEMVPKMMDSFWIPKEQLNNPFTTLFDYE